MCGRCKRQVFPLQSNHGQTKISAADRRRHRDPQGALGTRAAFAPGDMEDHGSRRQRHRPQFHSQAHADHGRTGDADAHRERARCGTSQPRIGQPPSGCSSPTCASGSSAARRHRSSGGRWNRASYRPRNARQSSDRSRSETMTPSAQAGDGGHQRGEERLPKLDAVHG